MGKDSQRKRDRDFVGSGDRVIIFRRSLWHSPTVSSLSPKARALMIELRAVYNGRNNGAIFLSVRDAAARLGLSCFAATMEAFDELRCAGLISRTIRGYFNIKTGEVSKAHAWNLNWISSSGKEVDASTIVASDLRALAKEEEDPQEALPYFQNIARKARKRMAARQSVLDRYLKDMQGGKFAVEENSTLDARRVEETSTMQPDTVEENATLAEGNGANPPTHNVEDSSAYIEHHSLGAEEASGAGWWSTDSHLQATATVLGILSAGRQPDPGRIILPKSAALACENCGAPFNPRTRVARFCGETCRKRVERRRARKRLTAERGAERAELEMHA